jgi:hypothetical protein
MRWLRRRIVIPVVLAVGAVLLAAGPASAGWLWVRH